MEQLYADTMPTIVSAGEYKTLYIVATIALYVLPLYFAPKGKIVIYFIWLACASAAAVLFFTNFSEFCNIVIHNYVIAGTNTSTVTNLQITNVYTQTIESVLSYNGVEYVIATYTNTYNYIPPAPGIPVTQYFLPWVPMEIYTIDYSGIVPLIYLILAIINYCLIIFLTIVMHKKQRAENIQDELRSLL
jgi:hypothetical protein